MVDIATLREGDEIAIRARFQFPDDSNSGGYVKAGGYASCFCQPEDILSVIRLAWKVGDEALAPRGDRVVVLFANDEIVLGRDCDGSYYQFRPAALQRAPALPADPVPAVEEAPAPSIEDAALHVAVQTLAAE